MFQTFMTFLWVLIRSTPTALRCIPTILLLISKAREAFGEEKVKELIRAFTDLIEKISPPNPDSIRTIPEPEQIKKRRWWRFRDRFNVAANITANISDDDVQKICDTYQIKPNMEAMA